MPAWLRRVVMLIVFTGGAAALAACGFASAEGKSDWTRTYTLAEGGTLEIENTNGLVEIEPSEGTAVSVVAERIAHAATEAAAKEAAEGIEIRESVSPGHITLASRQSETGWFGGSRQVKYHVKAPRWAVLRIGSTNGEIVLHGMIGDTHLETTNGRIQGVGLEGASSAETTNGEVNLEFARVPEAGVTCRATNGEVVVTIPRDAKVRVRADVTNGGIATDNLPLSMTTQSPRHLEGTMNGGGPTITIETTNGGIKIRGK